MKKITTGQWIAALLISLALGITSFLVKDSGLGVSDKTLTIVGVFFLIIAAVSVVGAGINTQRGDGK